MKLRNSAIIVIILVALVTAWYYNPYAPCPSADADPDGYLRIICQYIREKGINVSPAVPARYKIRKIIERQENGRRVFVVQLNCCCMGDMVTIDAETKTVINFMHAPC